jgi:pimeloyl-ACP methyl ester carboxylesterase
MDPSLVAFLAPMARAVLQGDLVRKATPQIEPPAAGRLGEIRAPTLVLVGDLDVDAVLATTDVLARGIPGARKHVISGTAHLPNLEQPDTFNALVGAFLAEHPLA